VKAALSIIVLVIIVILTVSIIITEDGCCIICSACYDECNHNMIWSSNWREDLMNVCLVAAMITIGIVAIIVLIRSTT
jgi:hypothetical protein